MHIGNADAFVEPDVTAHTYLLANCGTLARAQDMSFAPLADVFILRRNKTDLLESLTDVGIKYMASPSYQDLLRSSFFMGRSCEDELIDKDTASITLAQMRGFFFIFGCIVVTAVLTAVLQSASARLIGKSTRQKEPGDDEGTDAEMLLSLSGEVDQILQVMIAGQAVQKQPGSNLGRTKV